MLNISVRVVPERQAESLAALGEIKRRTFGGEFSYEFLSDQREAVYREDKRVARLYAGLTAIALLISAMGLFSMSLYDIQQRYKEIAVRKVHGASTRDIIQLMLKKYLTLLVIGFVIAAPLGWLGIFRYQQNFVQSASLPLWIFVAAFVITAAVTILTLLQQTRKAARTNPSIVMRFE